MKMPKTFLEVHRYAPELNKFFLRGFAIPCPGITTIREARQRLFKQPKKGRYVVASAIYPTACWKGLNKRLAGFGTYAEALEAKRILTRQTRGALLIDGSILPPAEIFIITTLIG